MEYNDVLQLKRNGKIVSCGWYQKLEGSNAASENPAVVVVFDETGVLYEWDTRSHYTWFKNADRSLPGPEGRKKFLADKYREALRAYDRKQGEIKAIRDRVRADNVSHTIWFFMFIGMICVIMFGVRACTAEAEQAERERPQVVSSQVERFILVTYNPPKHFYVTLKSVGDGSVYGRVYVSKHCNSHRDNIAGQEFNLQTSWMLNPVTKQKYRRFDNLYKEFC